MEKFKDILASVDMKAYKEKTKAGLKDAEDTRIETLSDEEDVHAQALSYEDSIRDEVLIAQSKKD